MLVLNFLPFLFSLALTAFPPHLELSYDLNDIPIAFATVIKPYINYFFQTYALASDPYVFSFSKNSSNVITNYTLIASEIHLKNLSVDWINTKMLPSDNNTFSVFVKRANASVCFNYIIGQKGIMGTPIQNNPFILNMSLIDLNVTGQFQEVPFSINNTRGFTVSLLNLTFTFDKTAIVLSPDIIRSTNITGYVFNELFVNRVNDTVVQWKNIMIDHLRKLINAYFAKIVESTHAPSDMEQFKGESLAVDLSIMGCPRIVKQTVGNSTKYILKIPAEFYLGWRS